MLVHPDINPVAISLGPLAVRWYGIMYLVGFGLFFFLARLRHPASAQSPVSTRTFDSRTAWPRN